MEQLLDMSLAELMEVNTVTASRLDQKISDAPASMAVITKQQIRERGYMNLANLLEDLPGIDINHMSMEESFNQVSFRGNVGNHKFMIMQNGVRISSPTGENIPISDNFPLFHAEQVEVMYGPASALYGADAFMGVINIITQKPQKIDGAEAAAVTGTDDYFYNYLNYGQALTDKIAVSLGGHWHASQNPDLSKSYPDQYAKTDLLTTSGAVARNAASREPYAAPTSSHSAYASIDLGDKINIGMNRSYLSHPSTTSNQPQNTLFGKDAVWETQIESYYGKYRSNFGPKLSGESLVNYSTYSVLPDSKFTNSFANFSAFKYASSEKLKLEQQLNYKISGNHNVIGGFTFEDFDHIPKTADLQSPFNTNRGLTSQNLFYLGTDNTLPVKIFSVEYQNYGAYLQTQSRWNSWLSTSAGLRYDRDSRFGGTFNPRLGAVFKPLPTTTAKLMYGESFLAPSNRFTYEHFGSFTGAKNAQGEYISDFFHIPNPNLRPEKARTIEFDLTHNVTPDFVLNGAVFFTRVTDTIGLVLKNETSRFIEGGEIRSFETTDNIGAAGIYGGEIRADYQIHWGRTASLKLWGSYSRTDGHIDESGGVESALPLVAANKIKSGATFTYAEKYFITPRIMWVDHTPNPRKDMTDGVRPYTLVNLYAGADDVFYKKLSFFVNVRNLLDTDYFNASVSIRNQAFGSVPQDPRRIFFGLRYKF